MISEELEMGVAFATSDFKDITEKLHQCGVLTDEETKETLRIIDNILIKSGYKI